MDQRIPREDGRTERFGELYAVHYRPLVAVCRRSVGDAHAEEVAQEAFLRAWSSWERYAPARPFWPWVSTIARRLCIDHGRRLRTAAVRGPHAVDGNGAVVPTPEEQVVASEEYRWARAALAELRPDHQRVLRLREVEGWSYDRIATHEGVTVESVRGQLRRARTRLRVVYARMSSSSPAVLLLAMVRGLRRRVSGWAYRTQDQAAASGLVIGRAGDAVAALVALAIGAGGVGAPAITEGAARLAAPPALNRSGGSAGGTVETRTTLAGHASASGGGAAVIVARDGHPRADVGVPGTKIDFVVPGRGDDAPEATSFQSFTPSPNYAQDHQVYASGYAYKDCELSCPSIFRSDNGGASWIRIRSLGFEGGPVMLAPSYPADPRIFVGGPHALKVSSDGGHTFMPLTPAGGFTAMSPGFSSGDPNILVGAIPGWTYHDDTKAVTPLDLVPESSSAALSFAYSPAYVTDHRLVIGGTDTTPATNSIVSMCAGSTCTPPAVLAGSTGTPAVMTTRRYQDTGLAFAWNVDHLYRSADAGASFAPLVLPAPGDVRVVADDATGSIYVALLDVGATGTTGGLFRSSNSGQTWTRLGAGTPLDHGTLSVVSLPDGHLLAAPYAAAGGGLECSADGGHTWAARCS